jgi:probable rRNA maturation factor
VGNQQNRVPVAPETKELVCNVLLKAAEKMGLGDKTEVSFTFVDNQLIKQLNIQYRGVEAKTDVLSFAFAEGVESVPVKPPEEVHLLGEIVVSLEQAVEQAREYGHSADREVSYLAVHGFLHLLGYGHDQEEDARKMRELEEEILSSLGLTRD